MTKISVVVPAYNSEKYIEECLDSLLKQTLSDIEIICINDGSTDNTAQILEKYSDIHKNIKVYHRENSGLSVSRNFAIDVANGEYISFVDSDDWVSPDFYEKLYNAAKKYEADVACTNLLRTGGETDYYIVKIDKYRTAEKVKYKYKYAHIPESNYVMNKIYKTSEIKRINLRFEPNIYYEDVEFSHKALYYMKKLVTVPEAVYYYRDNPVSIVNTVSKKHERDYYNSFFKALDFVQRKRIKIDYSKYPYEYKNSIKILGLPIIVIKKYVNCKIFYLFDKIRFLELNLSTQIVK